MTFYTYKPVRLDGPAVSALVSVLPISYKIISTLGDKVLTFDIKPETGDLATPEATTGRRSHPTQPPSHAALALAALREI